MSQLPVQLSWPEIAEPYASALRSAVEFICKEVDPIGIIATGTVIRGSHHPSSDLDLYVVHAEPYRRRIQRYFSDNVPAEIFINPPQTIRSYFVEEHQDGRPLTAHMLATGHLVLKRDSVVQQLLLEAKEWVSRPSVPDDALVLRSRYGAATQLEDARDIAQEDQAASFLLMSRAVIYMLEFWCRSNIGTIPRGKDLLARVTTVDPVLGALARRVFSDASFSARDAAANDIADRTIGARGFFEWDSGPQPLELI